LLSQRRSYTAHFFDFESGQVMKVFEDDGFAIRARLTVSPDEEWILYCERPIPTSELMLVENFR
jgi:hypothetical protein